jgi:hypothetical protein
MYHSDYMSGRLAVLTKQEAWHSVNAVVVGYTNIPCVCKQLGSIAAANLGVSNLDT